MKRFITLAALLLLGCTSDVLGPSDPGFDDVCTVAITNWEPVYVTRAQWEQCETIRVSVECIFSTER